MTKIFENRRSETEMYDLIKKVGQFLEVDYILLNGSRANENVKHDFLQDFDVVYGVTAEQKAELIEQQEWLETFGDRLIMQQPENASLFPPSLGGDFTFLMLFADGHRIDLMLTVDTLEKRITKDSLTVLLWSKTPFSGEIKASDQDYWQSSPIQETFADCCNEFWWVSTYVAKGLVRNDLIYAMYHLNNPVRDMLDLMIGWYLGSKSGFEQSFGKKGRHFQSLLSDALWGQYLKTFDTATKAKQWESLFEMVNLFSIFSKEVATMQNFELSNEEQTVRPFLLELKELSV